MKAWMSLCRLLGQHTAGPTDFEQVDICATADAVSLGPHSQICVEDNAQVAHLTSELNHFPTRMPGVVNSVFRPLIISLFCSIQARISAMHFSIRDTICLISSVLEILKLRYSWVSSA